MSYFDDASLVMIPSGYKTSKVYSVKPTDGSGDLTFSRSNDTATRVNSAGLIEKVRTNLIKQSQDFSTTWGAVSLTVSANTTANPLNGTVDADTFTLTGATTQKFIAQAFALNGTYTASAYLKAGTHQFIQFMLGTDSAVFANFNISAGSVGTSGGCTASIISVGNGWYRCVMTFSSTTGDNVFMLAADSASAARFSTTSSTGTFIAFGYQLELSDFGATSYIATTSAAVSVGPVANVPRLDYLNSSCPRLLLEPQRTNLITYSEQLNNAAWVTGQSGTGVAPVVTANNAISPDGTQNADTVVFNSGAGTTASDFSTLFQTFGGTTATYTGSFYAKTASGTAQIQVRIDGNNYDKFTITNQWQRFTLTKALTGTGNIFEMVIRRGLNEPMNASATIQLWGVQVELGAYATSYIPTLGAAVTRGADVCSKTGISSLIGQTEGTLFAEFTYNGVANSNEFQRIIATHTDINNRITVLKNGTTAELYVFSNNAGVTQVNSLPITGTNIIGTHKVALAYKANDYVCYLDGVQVFAQASGSVPATSAFYLGVNEITGTDLQLAGGISQALLFKTRLSNADLAALTA